MKYTPSQIKKWDTTSNTISKGWLPSRSENHKFESLVSRIKNAWNVLVGKYDVLEWES